MRNGKSPGCSRNVPSGKKPRVVAAREGGSDPRGLGTAALEIETVDENGAHAGQEVPNQWVDHEFAFGNEADGSLEGFDEGERIQITLMVGDQDRRMTLRWDSFPASHRQTHENQSA